MSERRETLSAGERRERNRQIADARAEGTAWREIAAKFRISERQARRAAAEAVRLTAEERRLDDMEPEAVLARIIEVQLRALGRVEELMEEADNSNAKVGAARATGALGSELRDSLAAAGLTQGRVVASPSGGESDSGPALFRLPQSPLSSRIR